MSDTSRTWVFRALDAISFSLILVSIEEWIRSRTGMGTPTPWYLQLMIFLVGIITGWFGDAGPNIKTMLLQLRAMPQNQNTLTAAIAENTDLKNPRDHITTRIATGLASFLAGAAKLRYPLLAVVVIGIAASLYLYSIHSSFEMYARPRIVTEEQANDLREYLSHHKAHAVIVKVNPHDVEAREYWAQLSNALRRTDWSVEISTADAPPNTLNDGLCIHETGMHVKPHFDPNDDPHQLLDEALLAAHIERNCGGSSAAGGEYKLFLLVGHRPLKIGIEDRPLFKLGILLQRAANWLMRVSAE